MSKNSPRLPGKEPKYLAVMNIVAVLALVTALFSVICGVICTVLNYSTASSELVIVELSRTLCKHFLVLYLPLIACIGGFCKIRKHNILMAGITAVILLVQLVGGVAYYLCSLNIASVVERYALNILSVIPGINWLGSLLSFGRRLAQGADLSNARLSAAFFSSLTGLLSAALIIGSNLLCLVFFAGSIRKETLVSSKVSILVKLLGIAAFLVALFIPLYEILSYVLRDYPSSVILNILTGSIPQHLLLLAIALTALVGSLLNIRRHSIPMTLLSGSLLLLQVLGNVGYFICLLAGVSGQYFTWIPGATLLWQCWSFVSVIFNGNFNPQALLFAFGNGLILLCTILCFATFLFSFEKKKKAAPAAESPAAEPPVVEGSAPEPVSEAPRRTPL